MNNYGDIGNKVAGWYARRLLEHAMPVIVLEKFAKVKKLPRNNTRVVEFRRSVAFDDATTPLQEGIQPEGSQFAYEDVSVEMQQFGDWSGISDHIDDFSKDDVLGDIVERQGEQIASTREALTWDVVRAGMSVRYANGAASRLTMTETSLYNAAEARKAVVRLQSKKAKKVSRILGSGMGYETYPTEAAYVGITHTDLGPELRDLHTGVSGAASYNHMVPVAAYGTSGALSENELGRFEDIRYITSPDLDPFLGAGNEDSSDDTVKRTNDKLDVYPTIIFGMHSFGCVALRGREAVTPIVKQPNVPRSADKLGQQGWAGWKFYFACLVLHEEWIHRIESAAKV